MTTTYVLEPPVEGVFAGGAIKLTSLAEALAFVAQHCGTAEDPDTVWWPVYEALNYAQDTGLDAEIINARGMLELALGACGDA